MTGVAPRFTGERPGRGTLFAYDEARHAMAYRLAMPHVEGKRVLDAGCGDGYGTAELAEIASKAVGVDASQEAVAGCRARWTRSNLRFVVADLGLEELPGEPFDVVLAFQILEHLREPVSFLRNLAGALAPDGVLILTTPNRLTSVSENPYHVHEYEATELDELLRQVFADVEVSGIVGNAKVIEFERRRQASIQRLLRLDPLRLRRILPRRLAKASFGHLARLVRLRVQSQAPDETPIGVEDFSELRNRVDAAADLLARCRQAMPTAG